MDIKTKFNHGDPVFFIKKGKVETGTVTQVDVNIRYTGGAHDASEGWGTKVFPIKVKYALEYKIDPQAMVWYDETELFSTKEELLASL